MLKRIPWRPIAAAGVLIITGAVFIDYLVTHVELRQQIRETPPALLAVLLALYFGFVGSLALINSAALRLCKTKIAARESLLLTMYSSIINFFGPLQSGPAFRALYLKQKHAVKLKDYTAASFVYYGFYALFSVLLLCSGILGWWLLALMPMTLLALLVWRPIWLYMAVATLIQISLLIIIFGVELQAVTDGIGLDQVLIYTGAANLALFVSITPGAIGFRESFLLLSERLHHIDPSTIVAANLIDRSVYIVLLLILAIGIFSTHAHRRLRAQVK